MDEAEHCHRLAFIRHGNIIAYGTSEEIRTKVMRGEVLELEPSDVPKAIKVLRGASKPNHSRR